jgi:prepilin-type N-terminal cleavage/methylation domain-containing protein
MQRKKAFTLIELLVVIAIIAILASILFPVFAQAKLAAKKTVSISNLKQIGLASKMYEGDYDDTVVMAQYCTITNSAPSLLTWENLLFPYIKNGENTTVVKYGTGNGSPDRDTAAGIWADPGAPDTQSFPYGIQYHLAPDDWGATCAAPNNGSVAAGVSDTSVPSQADSILILTKGRTEFNPSVPTSNWGWVYFVADEYAWTSYTALGPNGQPLQSGENDNLAAANGDCDGGSVTTSASPEVWAGCGMLPRYRYSGVCPVTFVDGHAKTMAKNSIHFGLNIYTGTDGQGIW